MRRWLAAGMVALVALTGLAAAGWGWQSHGAFESNARQAAARLDGLTRSGADAEAVAALRAQLAGIRGTRWGPLAASWLPEPLAHQGARLTSLMSDAANVERLSIARARLDASAALARLFVADPGLPPQERAASQARVDRAGTPAELRQVTADLTAAATRAAADRKLGTDLEPKTAALRALMERAESLGVGTGRAQAAIAAYDALLKLPARQVAEGAAAVGGGLDQAGQELQAAIAQATAVIANPNPASCLPGQQGHLIVLDLSDQHLDAYQDGCPFISTPVTTGMPALRTPTGTYHVIMKTSPYRFVSPWPPGSPYWYAPAWTNWVVEFISDGTFFHDAPWQPAGTYGPGSENGPYASHGCVHVPSDVMPALYRWAQPGDTVIVRP